MGSLEVAYTCPKVYSILQLEDTSAHAYRVWLETLGGSEEPRGDCHARPTQGAADTQFQLLVAQPGVWAQYRVKAPAF